MRDILRIIKDQTHTCKTFSALHTLRRQVTEREGGGLDRGPAESFEKSVILYLLWLTDFLTPFPASCSGLEVYQLSCSGSSLGTPLDWNYGGKLNLGFHALF